MDFLDLINHRREVNYFDPNKDVTDEILKEIVETAAKMPSSFNLQPWSLIVLRDPAFAGCGAF
jgi:nitroreductase